MLLRPNAPRIRQLLSELEDCKDDLANAVTADEVDCARAEIASLQHSLWLAGYQPEEEA